MGKLIIFEGWTVPAKAPRPTCSARRCARAAPTCGRSLSPTTRAIPPPWCACIFRGGSASARTTSTPMAASTFYAVDRFASYKTDWGEFYRTGGLVVSDRYTTSNAVHQCSKLRPCTGTAFWTGCSTLSTKKWASPRPTPSSTSRSMSKFRRGCWPRVTMATPPKWIFRKKIPNTWPAPAPRPNTARTSWAGGASTARARENGKKIMRTAGRYPRRSTCAARRYSVKWQGKGATRMGTTLRRAHSADLPALAALRAEAFGTDEAEARGWLQNHCRAATMCLFWSAAANPWRCWGLSRSTAAAAAASGSAACSPGPKRAAAA